MVRKRTLSARWLPILALIGLLATAACRTDTGASPTAAPSSGGSTGTSASPAAGGGGASATQGPAIKEDGVSDTEIVLGAHTALSGPASFYSQATRAQEAYFKEVNEERGVNGRKIRFVYEDDSFTPNRAVEVKETGRTGQGLRHVLGGGHAGTLGGG